MGVIPATGTEISMGRISVALGLFANTGSASNVGLNSTLGANRGLSSSNVGNKAAGTQTAESSDFGGISTPGTY